jgi:hypothetical protein
MKQPRSQAFDFVILAGRDSNRQSHCFMSISEADAPARSRLYFANPAGALCLQIPGGAVAFRDAPSRPHPRPRRRLGRASPARLGLGFVIQVTYYLIKFAHVFWCEAILGGHNKCRLMITPTRISSLKVAVLRASPTGACSRCWNKQNHAAD